MHRLPSLAALRAFDGVARHGSFARAADELCVTAPSLSHHVKALEDELGFRLFIRGHRSISLTPEGEALFAATRRAFGAMSRAWQTLKSAPVAFKMSSGVHFMANWLAPRSARLQVAMDGIDVDHITTFEALSLDAGEVDLAIRNGDEAIRDHHAETIHREWWTPMVSPDIASELRAPGDILRLPLIEARHPREPKGHPSGLDWLRAAGVEEDHPDVRSVPHTETAMQMAAEGLGVKLCASVQADQLHRQGRLVAPFDLAIRREGMRFYMICRRGEEHGRPVSALRTFFAEGFREMDARLGLDRMDVATLPAIARA